MVQRRVPRPTELRPLLRPAPIIWDPTDRRLARAASIADLRAIARRRTPRAVFDYTDGAADGELSLNRARAAFARVEFHPTVLRDVSVVDTGRDMLGRRSTLPFAFAPTGFTRMMNTEGERAVVAVAQGGHPVCASNDGYRRYKIWQRRPVARKGSALPVARPRPRQGPPPAPTDAAMKRSCSQSPPRRRARLRDGSMDCDPPLVVVRTFFDGAMHPHWWFTCSPPPWSSPAEVHRRHRRRAHQPVSTPHDQAYVECLPPPGPAAVSRASGRRRACRVVRRRDAVRLSNHGGASSTAHRARSW